MFKRILVANRGEIALRIIRAAHDLGIEAVAVYSEADRGAPYLDIADEAICIGPAVSAQSYLNIPAIIAAAEIADVEAIHPGYGFLAENAHFAEVCQSCGIKFIGPSPEVIDSCGDKSKAKTTAANAGVPVVPGSDGAVANVDEAAKIAEKIGYPVIIKAAAGGGGRGMRMAKDAKVFHNCFVQAQQEAAAAFNDSKVYVEKFIVNPRHVEVQILAGADGEVVHLGERDCSIQRRHQKLIEESPSPATTPEISKRMGEAAVAFAKAAGYVNAGTVEFLLDHNGDFYFIELNARIQVEHCVSEIVSGIDLVKWQIQVAAGENLDFKQEDIKIKGHAIEYRINAENPARNFAPAPGRIEKLFFPGGRGIRIDSHVAAGYTIPRHYDSMIAKLIAFGDTREEALAISRRALNEVRVEGPGLATTVPLHLQLLDQPEFQKGEIDTGYLERFLDS
ncbi:MAG: acetyl-CoA carboxylase biotin carboxylase subunit [Planctomycetes bacterium]|nr:acetyl-CoA carboxylase biotin carboxylase subunit [Planctomycetota bacterium]MCP4772419.1 acetyl-CoA carboxylase biotin carboxylase subunit [Planctomycetota bacterium]MCP4860188.1 acetyl-CoA carboxylase biotin carboxylase subunit [Planctomycetota bacterium]